jgi:uncharacterized membrane protein YphA (DoxX/SURF4 family)
MAGSLHRFSMKGLHWSVGVVLIIESARFAFGAGAAKMIAHMGLPAWVRPAIGVTELVAAVLFLLPPTTVLGGWILMLVFCAAAVVHLLHGQYDVSMLVIYAMAVLAVITAENPKRPMRAKR